MRRRAGAGSCGQFPSVATPEVERADRPRPAARAPSSAASSTATERERTRPAARCTATCSRCGARIPACRSQQPAASTARARRARRSCCASSARRRRPAAARQSRRRTSSLDACRSRCSRPPPAATGRPRGRARIPHYGGIGAPPLGPDAPWRLAAESAVLLRPGPAPARAGSTRRWRPPPPPASSKPRKPDGTDAPWWQRGVIYQIYPRSFQDSDGDGIGDLHGIAQRLDYLAWLGVDAIWISPIFPSPMADFGYDVADYCDVDPLFGTLADFDRLLAAGPRARAQAAPRLRAQPHLRPASLVRREPRRRATTRSATGTSGATRRRTAGRPTTGSATSAARPGSWDEATGQYYYHAFLKEQPDLNWRNPGRAGGDVRRAALLARPRRRRLPHRRALAPDQGRRTSATIRRTPTIGRRWASRTRRAASSTRPTSPRCTTSPPRCAQRRSTQYRRARADRRDLPAGRAAGRLLRPRTWPACTCRSTSS